MWDFAGHIKDRAGEEEEGSGFIARTGLAKRHIFTTTLVELKGNHCDQALGRIWMYAGNKPQNVAVDQIRVLDFIQSSLELILQTKGRS